jgi:tRNA (guanine-N7-)-methyltransferase
LSPRQQALLADDYPDVALDLSHPPRSLPRDFFSPPVEDVWLEIGFGGGEHLLWQAQRNPNVGLIGCEPYQDGIVKVLKAIKQGELSNIRLHGDDARAVLRWLPPESIGRAFILFPDPWPKTRHHKRRLVSEATLDELSRVMRPKAELRIATDHSEYAAWILLAVRRQKSFRWLADSAAHWRERAPDWPATRYEQKASQNGCRCVYFRFQRR